MHVNRSMAGKVRAAGWEFNPLQPRGHYTSNRDDKHFAHMDGTVTSLVREMAQNTGDAQAEEGTPPLLSFRVRTLTRGQTDALRNMYSPVLAHWDAVGRSRAGRGRATLRSLLDERHARVLVIEDYRTTGLLGCARSKHSGFSSFFRWSGSSEKALRGGPQGGQYGLGKTTIYAASQASSCFVLTIRADDPHNPLFMGKAMLPSHAAGKQDYDGSGFYYDSLWDGVGPEMPFMGAEAVELGKALGIDRNGMPGTSIVVPLPMDDVDEDSIRLAVAKCLFHQIGRGYLDIEVGGERLDADAVYAVLVGDGSEALVQQQRLGQSFMDGDVSRFSLVVPKDGLQAPLEAMVEGLERMREDWRRGRTIVVEAQFPFMDGCEQVDMAYAIRPRLGTGGPPAIKPTFVRRAVTISSGVGQMRRGTFLSETVSDRASAFLGDLEMPAHTFWKRPRQRDKAELLTMLTELPMRLEQACSPEEGAEEVRSALADFFKAPVLGDDGPARMRRPAKNVASVPEEGDVDTEAEAAESDGHSAGNGFDFRIGGGLTACMHARCEEESFLVDGMVPTNYAGRWMTIIFAYKVNKAESNFRKHDVRDFDVTKAGALVHGGTLLERTPNSVKVEVHGGPFSIAVDGFDEHRTLVRKVVVERFREPVQDRQEGEGDAA